MQISEFTGGLNTRVDPSLLMPNEGVRFRNIDNTSKILKSIREPQVVEGVDTIFGYFYNFKDTWLSSQGARSYVEYKNTVYWTEADKIAMKFDGQRESRIGIVAPETKVTLTQQDLLTAPAAAPTTTQTDPAAGGSGINDSSATMYYVYTYYDSVNNRESPPSSASTNLALDANKDVTVSNLVASAEDGVDSIKIYRTGDGVTTMTLVDTIPNAGDDYLDVIATANLQPFTIKADAGISGDAETLSYVYTYYNSQDGIESAPSPVSEEIDIVANKEVLVGNILASEDVQVDTIRLYRLGDGATEFTLLYEYPNSDDDIIDGTATIDAIGSLLDSQNNYPPPENGRYLTEAYGIMFMAVGDKLYFTPVGKPNYWPPAQFIDFANDITGLFPVPNGILVFSRTKTDILVGNNIASFAVLPVSSEHGSVSHYSGKLVKNVPTWVSLDGICNYITGIVRVVSKDKLDKITLDVVNSAVYDEQYWLCLSDGTILTMDTRFGVVTFKDFEFTDKLDNILKHDDTLYGRQGDSLVTLFDGDIRLALDYLSPVYTDNNHANTKLYNNVYIRTNSDHEFGIEVFIYIDGVLVTQKQLLGNKVHDVKVPQEKQRGSSIQFALKGVGDVYEIDYKVVGRQNGR